MAHYVFIESRDPFKTPDMLKTLSVAEDLRRQGNSVSLFLVQNGVLICRKKAKTETFQTFLKNVDLKIYADDYSLQERGILRDHMHPTIEIAGAAKLVDLIMEPDSRPTWY